MYNFRLGEPGLEVSSMSLLAIDPKSLRSTAKPTGELSAEGLKLKPKNFLGPIGLGLGLSFCFGLKTISLSSSELERLLEC